MKRKAWDATRDHDEYSAPPAEPSSPRPTPEQAALRSEVRQRVERHVASYREPQRAVARLCILEQRESRAVAERLAMTENAVNIRRHRIRKDLQTVLGDFRDEPWFEE